jgi:hypothetical protein
MSEKKEQENSFQDALQKQELINVKTNLMKLKIVLEKKMEDKVNELIQLKQELPHLVHLERMSKLEKENRDKK